MGNLKKTLLTFTATALFLSGTQIASAEFKDVEKNHPNYTAINYIQMEGIVVGYNDGTYRPDFKINRAEFTKILIAERFSSEQIDTCMDRELTKIGDKVFFSDVFRSDWYGKYICIAKTMNIIKGFEDGTFKPLNSITFAEAAKILTLSYGAQIGEETTPWYKVYVEALSNSKVIPTTITSFDQQITRGEMAEMIYRLIADEGTTTYNTYEDLE